MKITRYEDRIPQNRRAGTHFQAQRVDRRLCASRCRGARSRATGGLCPLFRTAGEAAINAHAGQLHLPNYSGSGREIAHGGDRPVGALRPVAGTGRLVDEQSAARAAALAPEAANARAANDSPAVAAKSAGPSLECRSARSGATTPA